jgi:NADH:ubiquinone oxidoreductase subunit K
MTSAEVSLALALVVYLHRRKSRHSDDYSTLQE